MNAKKIIKGIDIYAFCFIRLIIIPLLAISIMHPLIQDPYISGVMILSAAMPAGATNTSLADIYARNGIQASQYVAISSILSMFTLPFILFFS
ncbi:AEC family transporter [Bacillus thuringiensis]|uniref:AEC family transporter n=1 Tax=Bacillus thuringiensis TaxID=1428 RepID=UPI0026986D2E